MPLDPELGLCSFMSGRVMINGKNERENAIRVGALGYCSSARANPFMKGVVNL